MPRILTTRFIVVMIALISTFQLQAQPAEEPQEDPETLMEQSREAYENGQYLYFYIANMKLHLMRPQVPEYMYNIVRSSALLNRRTAALDFMLRMQQQGLSYDFSQTEDTVNIRNSEAYTYLNDLMIEAGQPTGEGSVALTLAGDPADFAALAWDGSRNKFLVGTISEGKLLAVGADGDPEILLEANEENGLWSINGLAVDLKRKRLWISSHATPRFARFSPAYKNRGSLFEFDLETLELLGRYNLPVDALEHELGSVALSDDGHVYVIDRATPIIYRKVPGGNKLEAYVGSADLVALQDIAVAPDNNRLFVADAVMGVFIVDPIDQETTMLGGPENLNLSGIRALEYMDGQLFVIQSEISPQRLLRLDLDARNALVENVSPMAIALEEFDHPGRGTIREGSIYYFANSGAEESQAGLVVMKTPLDAGDDVVPPNMQQFRKALEQNQQQ